MSASGASCVAKLILHPRSIPAEQDVEEEIRNGQEGDEEEQREDESFDHRGGLSAVTKEDMHEIRSPPRTNLSSPFPSVSLSPPFQQPRISPERDVAQPDLPSGQAKIEELSESTQNASQPTRSPIPPTIRREVQSLSLSRGRSTTGISLATVTSTNTVRASQRPDDGRFPTPPPFDDPLGPSARPPYLPAHSDYGGPTVYYSCRPGGACLFDLLGTLPMKQFGVLDWEVLDREEEIYESDDVKEEYKIMHALWARWIMLHR